MSGLKRTMPVSRSSRQPAFFRALCASAVSIALFSCSQNSFEPEGAAPPAPANPRVARPIQKDAGGGMGMAPMPADEPQPSPAAGEGVIAGTIHLPEALKSTFKPGTSLFVIARVPGNPMPLAAQKHSVDSFPFSFMLGAEDSMVGEALPQDVELILRLDQDGDITTRSAGDLVAGPVEASLGQRVNMTLEESEQ
jgi:hypothetical protein